MIGRPRRRGGRHVERLGPLVGGPASISEAAPIHRIAVGSIALASGLFIAAPATSGSEIRGNLYSLPPIASLNGTRIEIRVSVNPRSTAATTALRIKDLLGEQKDRELDVVVRTDGRFAIEIPDDPKNQLLW